MKLQTLQKEPFHSIKLFFIFSYQYLKNALFAKPNLYSKYKHDSLAIITNAFSLDEVCEKAEAYNIPLMYAFIRTKKEEEIIYMKLLTCFEVAQFINQSFVFYGEMEEGGGGMIMFIKDKQIYGRIKFDEMEKMEPEQILEKLEELRNRYYDQGKDDESLQKEESNDQLEV